MRKPWHVVVPLGLGIASLVPGLFGWRLGSVVLFVVGASIAGWHLHEAPARAGFLVSTPLAVGVALQLLRRGSPVDDVGPVTASISVVTVVSVALIAAHVAAGTHERMRRRRQRHRA